MARALEAVRRSLGPDAVILETRPVSGEGRERRGVEVVAAADRHPDGLGALSGGRPAWQPERASAVPAEGPASDPAHTRPASHPRPRPAPRPLPPVAPRPVPGGAPWPGPGASFGAAPGSPAGDAGAETARLRRRVAHLSRLVASEHFSRLPARLRDLYCDLATADVDANLAYSLIEILAGEAPLPVDGDVDLTPLRRRLTELLDDRAGADPMGAGEAAPAAHLLVGAAGAGKTTVAAALAAWILARGCRPALISCDTWRAGGGCALEHTARLLGVPFLSAFSPDEVAAETERRLRGYAPLILDTPALSRRDGALVDELRAWAATLPGTLVHLVLQATEKLTDAAALLETARGIAPASLVFTRMDETASFGGPLTLSLKARLPVSFLNAGRDITRSLRACSTEELVALALDAAQPAAPAVPPASRARMRPEPRPWRPGSPSVATAAGRAPKEARA